MLFLPRSPPLPLPYPRRFLSFPSPPPHHLLSSSSPPPRQQTSSSCRYQVASFNPVNPPDPQQLVSSWRPRQLDSSWRPRSAGPRSAGPCPKAFHPPETLAA
eukprot:753536-Hanusia_phi.AAC.5